MRFSEDKVALITGGSRGIGAACVLLLAKKGYKVAVHYRSQKEQAEKLCAEIGESAHPFCFDLSQEGSPEALVKEVKQHFGRIDILVNNAGCSIDQMITFAKPADFQTLLQTNLISVFALTKAVSKIMIKQKSGSIINMSSVVGHTGNGGQSMYAATKGAITSFTKSIAVDLAAFGIRCNCVAPGFIETDMTGVLSDEVKQAILNKIPLKRLGSGQDVAYAVAFLASDESAYVTGSTIHVNGGMYPN